MLFLPPLDSLRFFEAAARLQGFARAAEELGVTPTGPPVTRGTPSWKDTFAGERPDPAGVTSEHLPGPKTAGFRMGRSPTRPRAHWSAPVGCVGCWIVLRARDLRAARV